MSTEPDRTEAAKLADAMTEMAKHLPPDAAAITEGMPAEMALRKLGFTGEYSRPVTAEQPVHAWPGVVPPAGFSPERHPGREMTPETAAAHELQRLEYTEAHGLLSPADVIRIATPALREHLGVDPGAGMRSRSCPSCHSIGPADDGCADAWHAPATDQP